MEILGGTYRVEGEWGGLLSWGDADESVEKLVGMWCGFWVGVGRLVRSLMVV